MTDNLRPFPLNVKVDNPTAWLDTQPETVRRVTSVQGGRLMQRPWIEAGACVDPTALLIGGVIVRAGCYIGPFATVRLDEKSDPEPLIIGAGTNLQDFALVHARTHTIGSRVIVAHQAIVHGAVVEDDVTLYIQAAVDGDGTVIGRGSFLHRASYVGKGIRVPPGRFVEPGQNVLTQADADALPPVPDALLAVREHVLADNDSHCVEHSAMLSGSPTGA